MNSEYVENDSILSNEIQLQNKPRIRTRQIYNIKKNK